MKLPPKILQHTRLGYNLNYKQITERDKYFLLWKKIEYTCYRSINNC